MKLISCESCGVVLDLDRLDFPSHWWTEDGEVDTTKAIWDSDTMSYVPFIRCPVCNSEVTE
jgi:hypothetical protein